MSIINNILVNAIQCFMASITNVPILCHKQ